MHCTHVDAHKHEPLEGYGAYADWLPTSVACIDTPIASHLLRLCHHARYTKYHPSLSCVQQILVVAIRDALHSICMQRPTAADSLALSQWQSVRRHACQGLLTKAAAYKALPQCRHGSSACRVSCWCHVALDVWLRPGLGARSGMCGFLLLLLCHRAEAGWWFVCGYASRCCCAAWLKQHMHSRAGHQAPHRAGQHVVLLAASCGL